MAVTIRVLMDEELTVKDKVHLVIKEIKVGLAWVLLIQVMNIV